MENTKECRNEHSMNSGWIYSNLCEKWEKYPRYLFSEIENKLDYILIRDTRKLHLPLTWEANRNYIEKSLREEKQYQERIKDDKNPPYTDFFMQHQKGGVEYYLIQYESNFLLTYENDEGDFDFFFALKLLVTDEMKLKAFLTHQLAVNFSDNFSQYKEFVDIVLIKYKEFLANGKIDVIVNKFFQKENQIRETLQQEQLESIAQLTTGATLEAPLPQIEKPTFKADSIEIIFNILKGYFPEEQQAELKGILEKGDNVPSKLFFKDNGNKLADVFKKMYDAQMITGCKKKELQQWILQNFSFRHKNKRNDFTESYLNDIISGNARPCKNPIVEIIKDKEQFKIVPTARIPKQHKEKM